MRATSSSYQARICGQSVSSARGASSCRAAIAASILVAAGPPLIGLHGERRLQDAHALSDLARVPQAAVLPVERDDPAFGVQPRGEPSVVEQHQREQSARLGFLRGERELAGEPDRLAGQIHPARVTGCVDEIEHAQHDGEVPGLVQAAAAQRALGPADPLRHRRLWHVEGIGDPPVVRPPTARRVSAT